MIFSHVGQQTLLVHLSLSGIAGYFSGAEGFFFLSGLVFARVYRRRMLERGIGPTGTAIAQRVFKLYRYHLACIACVLIASRLVPQQLLALDESYRLFIEQPSSALLRAALLFYQPNLLDVLPLYIVYLPFAWLLVRSELDGSHWVAVCSLFLWAAQQFEQARFGRVVSPGAFNIVSYQAVFFLGLWAAHGIPRLEATRPGRLSPLLASSLLVTAACFLLSHANHLGVTVHSLKQASLLVRPHCDKFSLGWLRLLNFGAVALLLQQARPWLGWLSWRPIAALGKRSLGVFAGHVILLILLCGPVLKLRGMSTPVIFLMVLAPLASLAFFLTLLDRHGHDSRAGRPLSSRARRRWMKLSLLVCITSVVGCVAIALRAALTEIAVDFTPRSSHPTVPAASPLKPAATVTFRSQRGDQLSAWWLEGKLRSPVIFIHGTDAARDQLLPEAEVLQEDGFSVLLLDLPGHGESSGRPVWGRAERSAIEAAISFVNRQVPGAPVGLFAFSAGAIVAAQVAATNHHVQAVLLTGAPADFDRHIMAVYSGWGWLSSYPAIWAAHVAGYRNDAPTTVEAISNVSRVLVVTGMLDAIVPYSESIRVFQSAREPKQLLRVPGAQHGNYMEVMGRRAYAQSLTEFFERHLVR